MLKHLFVPIACLVVITTFMTLTSQTFADDLPQNAGLSKQYPGDKNIADDPAVLLAESFETGDIDDLAKRWNSVSNKDGKVLAFTADSPAAHAGKRCLQATGSPPANTGGHLYRKLPRQVEQVFARFYVKFPEDAGYVHHFVHLGGYDPATAWPQGGAGSRPEGNERMTVGIEPAGGWGRSKPPGHWNFYTYWHEMKVSAGGKYWGNSIRPVEPAAVPRGQWQCVEVMLKLNTPGQRDGELALWLDGTLNMHVQKGVRRNRWTGMGFEVRDDDGGEPFEGFSWRTSKDLKINFFWLLHYVTTDAARRNRADDPSKPVRVWFDNIVISEKYVGPISE